MPISLVPLQEASDSIVATFNRWNNDPAIVHLIRPVRSEAELVADHRMTVSELIERLKTHDIFLIYDDDRLVGEVNVMYDAPHLYDKQRGSAWLGLVIGEQTGRGKGVGTAALTLLADRLRSQGVPRIELGVFAFNEAAHRLYQRLGYYEIARVEAFTYWDGQFWPDIRMEKRLD
ncbi:GNAT family N-acetyltransferase [Exiguobacterium sp. AM39-5BH]|uniref:GNAT family N-acetyltransferase n=1 Tax=Exiguobacterium sp. AM39-5BH TaxID=2292355 RepID=UPI000FE21B5F|nr:GNAT family N-acetyltransferase [Exiguobacterium sp. AM39-5BH]RHB50112.1 GNAT family N-acetyltransferase [Exiguobacterium sp. AM39-5BH]